MRAAVIDTVLHGGHDTRDLAVFERARRVGFAGVEVELSREDLRSSDGRRLASLSRARAATGLETPSLVLGGHNPNGGIADDDPAVAEAAAEDVRAAVRWASELGADIVLVPFFMRGELADEDALARCVVAFRALCPAAEAAGVTLCYEGTLAAEDVRRLAAGIGSQAFGCYFDLANPLFRGLDSATELRQLDELVRRVHFKESRARRGDVRPGLGRVDYAESARALAEIGYDGWLVFETPAAPPEAVARDLSFARSFFPALEPAVAWPRFGTFSHDFAGGEWERLGETFRSLGLEVVQLAGPLLDAALDDPSRFEDGPAVAGLGPYRNLVASGEGRRREGHDYVARCLELAPLLGTSVVATHSGTRRPESEWADSPENRGEEAWTSFLAAIEALLPIAERTGAILALEGHVSSVLRTTGRTIELLDRFPSAHLGLVCDPYNYLSRHLLPAQERATAEFLDRFEHRFVLAHLKDVSPGGAEDETPAFGDGIFVQRPYLEFLRTRRSDLPLILEHLPLERIPEAMRLATTAARPG